MFVDSESSKHWIKKVFSFVDSDYFGYSDQIISDVRTNRVFGSDNIGCSDKFRSGEFRSEKSGFWVIVLFRVLGPFRVGQHRIFGQVSIDKSDFGLFRIGLLRVFRTDNGLIYSGYFGFGLNRSGRVRLGFIIFIFL